MRLVLGLWIYAGLVYDVMVASGRKSLVGRLQFPLILGSSLLPGRVGGAADSFRGWRWPLSVALERWQRSAEERPGDDRFANLPWSHWLFAGLFLFSLLANPRLFGDHVQRAMHFLVGGLLLASALLFFESLRHLRRSGPLWRE